MRRLQAHRRFVCNPLYSARPRVPFPAPELAVGRPPEAGTYANWEENHVNSYSWIRVVTDDWEYTERVA